MLTIKADKLALNPKSEILDLGCGQGRHSFYLSKLGYLAVPVDLSLEDLKYTSTIYMAMEKSEEIPGNLNPNPLMADAHKLPFKENSFDCVIASEILEHITDDVSVMAEIARVIKPGSILAVSVPRYYPEAINWLLSEKYHNVAGGHVRIYTKSQLLARLKRNNFYLVDIDYAHGLHSPYWWIKCLVGIEKEGNIIVKLYKKILEYEIIRQPNFFKYLNRILDPIMGKSIIIYARYLPCGA